MKKILLLALLPLLLLLGGCGGGADTTSTGARSKGSMVFQLNLSDLAGQASVSRASGVNRAAVLEITAVSVTLVKDATTVSADLTVSGNVATGTIEKLEPGYWQVTADAYSNGDKLFTGVTDVKVVAGAAVQATILFDPVEALPPTTGSVDVTVGLNPMPGYRPMSQTVTEPMFAKSSGKLFILDAAASLIAVYNAETMARENDFVLDAAPVAVALALDESAIFLGYASGKIYRLDVTTGAVTVAGDVLMEIYHLVPVSSKYMLVAGKGSWDTDFKTMDITTGQVVATKSYYYDFAQLVLNPSNGVVYGHDWWVSPTDLFRFWVDPATGAIDIMDSPYHGDFYLGTPLRIINKGTRLATSGGTTFVSSSVSAQDLRYAGALGQRYFDLVSDDDLGYLYLLTNTSVPKLAIMKQENFFTVATIDLSGDPKRIFATDTSVIILSTKDSRWYSKVLSKDKILP